MSMSEIIRLVIKIARALQYAHNRRVVHRDVKPTNIMVDEFGEPLLTDFGVAALFDWPSCTVAGALTGTPLYMSPEQARADRVGHTSDIYSLGVVLYEAVTGVLPYNVSRNDAVQAVLEAGKLLRRCLRSSTPRSEWPAPFLGGYNVLYTDGRIIWTREAPDVPSQLTRNLKPET